MIEKGGLVSAFLFGVCLVYECILGLPTPKPEFFSTFFKNISVFFIKKMWFNIHIPKQPTR
ncbi:hypothetical protein A9Z65_02585 [Moraxella nonliquefaciens]|nr:hypothetical protein A9Z65_02585 [Moraxella nonliquefaciens]